MIEFNIPDSMDNGQLERVLTAIEAALAGYDFGPFAPKAINEAIADHGEQAIFELIGSYIANWCGGVCPKKAHLQW